MDTIETICFLLVIISRGPLHSTGLTQVRVEEEEEEEGGGAGAVDVSAKSCAAVSFRGSS